MSQRKLNWIRFWLSHTHTLTYILIHALTHTLTLIHTHTTTTHCISELFSTVFCFIFRCIRTPDLSLWDCTCSKVLSICCRCRENSAVAVAVAVGVREWESSLNTHYSPHMSTTVHIHNTIQSLTHSHSITYTESLSHTQTEVNKRKETAHTLLCQIVLHLRHFMWFVRLLRHVCESLRENRYEVDRSGNGIGETHIRERVCVCVCERERESVCVYVRVRESVCVRVSVCFVFWFNSHSTHSLFTNQQNEIRLWSIETKVRKIQTGIWRSQKGFEDQRRWSQTIAASGVCVCVCVYENECVCLIQEDWLICTECLMYNWFLYVFHRLKILRKQYLCCGKKWEKGIRPFRWVIAVIVDAVCERECVCMWMSECVWEREREREYFMNECVYERVTETFAGDWFWYIHMWTGQRNAN